MPPPRPWSVQSTITAVVVLAAIASHWVPSAGVGCVVTFPLCTRSRLTLGVPEAPLSALTA